MFLHRHNLPKRLPTSGARGAWRAVFSPCVRRRSRRAMGHVPPLSRAELRQEVTARACGPWSGHTPTTPRTNIRKGAAAHPAGACCAGIYTPQPMARRLRLLTHGLKIARRAPRAPVNCILLAIKTIRWIVTILDRKVKGVKRIAGWRSPGYSLNFSTFSLFNSAPRTAGQFLFASVNFFVCRCKFYRFFWLTLRAG